MILIIDIKKLKIVDKYEGDTSKQNDFGGKYGNKDKTAHIVAPIDYETKIVVKSTKESHDFEHNGKYYSFEINQEKIDKMKLRDRKDKMSMIREERDRLLLKADNGVNKHFDNDSNATKTLDKWKAYRIALRNVTDNYKDYKTNSAHADNLDALKKDISDFVWPNV